jgi:hypothetical protein
MITRTKFDKWWSWKAVVPRGFQELRVTGRIEPFRTDRWVCEGFTVKDSDMTSQLGGYFHGGRFAPPGDYTWLKRVRDGKPRETVMSDTPDELHDHAEPIWEARRTDTRRILINGLGLGCVLRGVLAYPHVEHVDVVEIDAELVDLMIRHADWVRDPRVEIHVADAYEMRWPVGTRWDFAWHDVWDTITSDNNFARLHRMYGRRVEAQASWGFELAKRRY